jgi:putative ABC transport system permease protein
MLSNYFTIAVRTLLKNSLFSLLNITGLAVGMAACLLIVQYVRFEKGYDRQSPHAERIWRGYNQTIVDGAIKTEDANTHSALGPSLKNDLPTDVEDYARIFNRGEVSMVFIHRENPVRIESSWLADASFLRLFPQTALVGDLNTCLNEPYALVLTRKAALQIFPTIEAALGQTLRVPAEPFNGLYTVKAVVEDPPANVHIKFNALGSYASRYATGYRDNWEQYWEYTYLQLSQNADIDRVRKKLSEFSDAFLKTEGIRLAMQPLTDIHLHSALTYEIEPNGSARSVRFLSITALLILLIAFVNYINLTTARAMKRGREVGLRKAIGASRGQIIRQFLFEGAILNLVSMGIALLLVFQFMPVFSKMLDRPLNITPGYDLTFWGIAASLWLTGILTACLWPAISLSSFSPLAVLKRDIFHKKDGLGLRQGLVVFQFACSTILIIAVMTISKQLDFLKNHDKGLSLDHIVTMRMPTTDWRLDSLNRPQMEAMKNEILQVPGVQFVAASSIVPSIGIGSIEGTSNTLYQVQNSAVSAQATTYFVNIEKGFLETYNIPMAAGRYYEAPNEEALSENLLINEAARKMLGFPTAESAVGAEIAFQRSRHPLKIHGVIADFHIESLKEPTRPTLYYCYTFIRNGYLSMKINSDDIPALMARIRPIWQRFWPESPMDWQFLDEKFDSQYRAEQQLSWAFGVFSGLAILIACLGLFGLATFTAEQRIKEIGIRKVLGATVAGITGLLAKDFIKLVILAVVIAIPVAAYAMQHWLMDFAYRIDLQWWMYAAAGIIAVAIALLTICFQSIKAALANPVKSLRSE